MSRTQVVLVAIILAVFINLDVRGEIQLPARDEEDLIPDDDCDGIVWDPVYLIPELESEDEAVCDTEIWSEEE